MGEQMAEATNITTSSGGGKIADTSETAWRHGFDDVTVPLEHGRLLLGADSETPENGEHVRLRQGKRSVYVTQYRIDHGAEMKKLPSTEVFKQCVPCFTCGAMGKQERLVGWIWYLLASKLLLFTVHLCTIVFGVVKEAVEMRQHESMKQLYLVNSFIEIFFTVFVVVMHMLNARMGYIKIRLAVQRLEGFDLNNDKHLRSVKTWMWLLVASGFVHIAVSVGCFIAFHMLLHLGWTVLSNQLCILSMNTLFAVYDSVMTAAVIKIKDDQQQVVMQEGAMLLRDRCKDVAISDDITSMTTTSSSREAAVRFIDAFLNTKPLTCPQHISVSPLRPSQATEEHF